MSLTIRKLRSINEFRAMAGAWDDLWARSSCHEPMARAAFVAHWVESFAPRTPFCAVTVEDDGRLVAAIPMLERRLKGVFKVFALPTNHWATNGDLLLDPAVDAAQTLDALVAALGDDGPPMLWFDRVPYDGPHWLEFQAAIQRADGLVGRREAYHTAFIEIGDDFDAYEAGLAGSHRRNCRSRAKSLERTGGADGFVCGSGEAEQLNQLVHRGFEVEDRSWKGTAGTSVLKSPGMLEFYQAEARLAAELGHLDLSFLEHQERAIAFAYTMHAKGTYFEIKLGYDEQFKKFGPGHLLLRHKLRRLFADPSAGRLDCRGPVIPWILNWTDRTYPVGRLFAAPPTLLGRTLFRAYEEWWPRIRSRLRPAAVRSAEPTETETAT
jgi:CelD/BcsL family acetyltransferase involved in cellulose biosynthesis